MEFKHAYNFIASLCRECYIQPMVVENIMRKVYEATIKYQTKLWSRITVDKLLKCHVGTNHVQSFAYNQVRRTKDKKVYFECVIENLKILRKSTVFEENEAKTNMIKAKIEMKKKL